MPNSIQQDEKGIFNFDVFNPNLDVFHFQKVYEGDDADGAYTEFVEGQKRELVNLFKDEGISVLSIVCDTLKDACEELKRQFESALDKKNQQEERLFRLRGYLMKAELSNIFSAREYLEKKKLDREGKERDRELSQTEFDLSFFKDHEMGLASIVARQFAIVDDLSDNFWRLLWNMILTEFRRDVARQILWEYSVSPTGTLAKGISTVQSSPGPTQQDRSILIEGNRYQKDRIRTRAERRYALMACALIDHWEKESPDLDQHTLKELDLTIKTKFGESSDTPTHRLRYDTLKPFDTSTMSALRNAIDENLTKTEDEVMRYEHFRKMLTFPERS